MMKDAGKDLETPTSPLMLVQAETVLDDLQLSSLRRAATALLIFSILSLRDVSGWLGLFAACTTLCSTASALSRRTCRVKMASSFAAGFAIVGFAACIACVIAGAPQHLSREMQKECYSMPQDTFAWGKQAIGSFEHMDNDHLNREEANQAAIDDTAHRQHHTPELSEHHTPEFSGQHEILVAWYSPHRVLKAVAELVNPEQKQMCNRAAQLVADWGSALLLAGAFFQWCLFVSAIIVAVYMRRIARHPCATTAAPAVIVASPIISQSTSA